MFSKKSFRPLESTYRSNHPFRTLFSLLNRPWYFYVGMFLAQVVKHSPVWVIPFLTARVINTLADPVGFPLSHMLVYFAVVVLLIVQNIPSHTLYVSLLSGAVRDLERALRSALVTRLQHLSIAFHDRTESGRLQAKLMRDVEQVQMLCMQIGDAGAWTGAGGVQADGVPVRGCK